MKEILFVVPWTSESKPLNRFGFPQTEPRYQFRELPEVLNAVGRMGRGNPGCFFLLEGGAVRLT